MAVLCALSDRTLACAATLVASVRTTAGIQNGSLTAVQGSSRGKWTTVLLVVGPGWRAIAAVRPAELQRSLSRVDRDGGAFRRQAIETDDLLAVRHLHRHLLVGHGPVLFPRRL